MNVMREEVIRPNHVRLRWLEDWSNKTRHNLFVDI